MTSRRGPALTPGRVALVVGAIIYAAVLGWIALTGPDPLPAHLGADGQPTRWESRSWVLGAAAASGAGLLAMTLGCRALIRRVSPEMLSLPSKRARDYWTTPERRPELDRRLSSDLELIVAATFLLLAWVVGALARAADGSGDGTLTVAILVYTVVLVGITLVMFLGPRYRAPEGWTQGPQGTQGTHG